MTLAAPMAVPPKMRRTVSIVMLTLRPVPIELMNCRSDEHNRDAAVAVGQRASEPGADRGAQKGAGDRETEHRGADLGPVLYRVNRAVDYRGVKTEQESSHRSGSGDEDNFTESDASIELAVVRGISYDRHKYLVIYYDNCAGASDRRAHSIRT